MEYTRNIPRFMIAATGSGSGKTTAVCGLLRAFVRRGVDTVSFKCGPDYIDPMFHTEILGVSTRNLDLFFTDEETTRYLLCRGAERGFRQKEKEAFRSEEDPKGRNPRLAVIEGVMGYYDGLAALSVQASSYDLARVTETPTILLLDCKGKSVSLAAEIKGFLSYRSDSRICGVILNRLSPMLYPDMKALVENELGVQVYGFLPVMKDCGLESRHLGLVTAKEVGNLREIADRLADQMEKTVDLDGLLALAQKAKPLKAKTPGALSQALCSGSEADRTTGSGAEAENGGAGETADAAGRKTGEDWNAGKSGEKRLRLGVAMDKAFCFYYQDNLDLLEELGMELVFFSPLSDQSLPRGLSGLMLGGGYPELYLERLSENQSLAAEIRRELERGMPCVAECGGFMYLHQWIEDESGKRWPMAGVIEGGSYPTSKLGRFGYIELTAREDCLLSEKGEILRGHEFHYWDAEHTGCCYRAQKPLRNRGWECILKDGINTKQNLSAGYPHVHFYSNINAARRFVNACAVWEKENVPLF